MDHSILYYSAVTINTGIDNLKDILTNENATEETFTENVENVTTALNKWSQNTTTVSKYQLMLSQMGT